MRLKKIFSAIVVSAMCLYTSAVTAYADTPVEVYETEIVAEYIEDDGSEIGAIENEQILSVAQESAVMQSSSGDTDPVKMILISLAIGLVVALVVCLSLKAQLKTAVRQSNAKAYVKPGSRNVTYARDIYLYKKVTKVKVEKDNN